VGIRLIIRLTARHPGTVTVIFQLRRPWENTPIRDRSITVTVIATNDTNRPRETYLKLTLS